MSSDDHPFPVSLPPYSPSPNTPSYSTYPSANEQRLASNGADFLFRRLAPNAIFEKCHKRTGVSLTLFHQEDGASMPWYGRDAWIEGHVSLADSVNVESVDVKLEGRLDLIIAEGGKKSTSMFSNLSSLWRRSELSNQPCPHTLPFRIRMPSTFIEHDGPRPLPPTYDFLCPGVPGLSVHSSYTIRIIITRARKVLWNSTQQLKTDFVYYPRTRTPTPLMRTTLPFSSALKVAPEEYFQIECRVNTRTESGLAPINCNLFIPSSQASAIAESIPFHLHLAAPKPSLDALFPTDPGTTNNFTRAVSTTNGRHRTIRVYLLRQIRVEVRGQRVWRTTVLGEGQLVSSPPQYDSDANRGRLKRGTCEAMDWDGTVKVTEKIAVGGFAVDNLVVKDFIVLEITPPNPSTNPLLVVQHTHPIRLVTDSCEDIWDA